MSILSLLSRICLTNPLFYSWPAIIFFFPLLLLCGVITVISLSNGCVLCDGWTGSQTHRRLILFEERSVFRLKRPFYNIAFFFFLSPASVWISVCCDFVQWSAVRLTKLLTFASCVAVIKTRTQHETCIQGSELKGVGHIKKAIILLWPSVF